MCCKVHTLCFTAGMSGTFNKMYWYVPYIFKFTTEKGKCTIENKKSRFHKVNSENYKRKEKVC